MAATLLFAMFLACHAKPLCLLAECSAIYFFVDIRVVRASASGAVDSGLISSRVKPMTLKLVFTASLLDVQH